MPGWWETDSAESEGVLSALRVGSVPRGVPGSGRRIGVVRGPLPGVGQWGSGVSGGVGSALHGGGAAAVYYPAALDLFDAHFV